MAKFENLAIDGGVSGWKIGRGNSQFYLTSLVARGPLRERVNGVFTSERSNESIDNIAVNLESGLYYVGNAAKFSQSPPWSGYGKERYGQPEFMNPMTHAAMSEARITGNSPVVITTAIPAKWKDETINLDGRRVKVLDTLKDHFGRDVVIDRDGQRGQRVISVSDVKVITETQALLYSFLLDKSGSVAVDNYQRMRFTVVDIGEMTTCIDTYFGMERQGAGLTLTDITMGQVHKATAARILEHTGLHLSHWEVRDSILAGGKVMTPARGNRPAQEFDITPIYQEVISSIAPALRSQFGDYITRADDIHYIIVGGGGSEVLGHALTIYEQARIVGQFATLQGLRNFGELVCAAKNG